LDSAKLGFTGLGTFVKAMPALKFLELRQIEDFNEDGLDHITVLKVD